MQAGAGAPGPVASPTLAEATFAVVDVETTGFSARRHRILQVAVVEARADGTVTDRWVTYVRPRFRWFRRLGPTHIHGIRRRDLRGAPLLPDALAEVARRLEGRVLTAHNLGFDRAFLKAGARRTGTRLAHDGEVCTLVLARRLDPGNEWSHKLADLCARYAVPLEHAHDALADAEATAALLPHLLGEAGVSTLGELAGILARRGPDDPATADPTGPLPRPPAPD